jgi:acyl-CoA dehydrogenase
MKSALLNTPDTIPTLSVTGTENLKGRAEAAAAAAADNADAVDREARFPTETFAAVRTQRLLGMLVPIDLGGDGASVSDVVDVCYMLGKACGSSAMIFAMHQIMVAILIRHARASAWHQDLLRRLCKEQLLLASSTTENQTGGDVRASTCVAERTGSRIALVKNATVMSYGAQADGILTTARRSADGAPSDQVLVAFLRDDYKLERIVDWDVLGMRATCSTGFTLRGEGNAEQILPEAYEKIHTQSVVPVAHLTWSGVWTGIAAGAVDRARRFVRGAARHGSGQLPPGAAHLTRAVMSLRALRGSVSAALQRYEIATLTVDGLEALEFQTAMNLLKVNSSESAIETVMSAMQACGLSGYRNTGEFSICRSLRDVLSSSIMINNDRILANAASALLLVEIPTLLRD